jgi:hypothetical protein
VAFIDRLEQHMGASTKRFPIDAVDSAGRHCTLIVTEYWITHQRDGFPYDVLPKWHRAACETLDRAAYETEDGQILIRTGAGKFCSTTTGVEFTTDDPRVLGTP